MNGFACIHFIVGACSLFSTLISISCHCSDLLRDQEIFVKMTAEMFSRMWNHYIFGGFMITMALIMFIYVFICIYICIYLSWKKQSNEVTLDSNHPLSLALYQWGIGDDVNMEKETVITLLLNHTD